METSTDETYFFVYFKRNFRLSVEKSWPKKEETKHFALTWTFLWYQCQRYKEIWFDQDLEIEGEYVCHWNRRGLWIKRLVYAVIREMYVFGHVRQLCKSASFYSEGILQALLRALNFFRSLYQSDSFFSINFCQCLYHNCAKTCITRNVLKCGEMCGRKMNT